MVKLAQYSSLYIRFYNGRYRRNCALRSVALVFPAFETGNFLYLHQCSIICTPRTGTTQIICAPRTGTTQIICAPRTGTTQIIVFSAVCCSFYSFSLITTCLLFKLSLCLLPVLILENLLTQLNRVLLETMKVTPWLKNSPWFMEPESYILCSRKPTTGPKHAPL
jgi:hypothetical protein